MIRRPRGLLPALALLSAVGACAGEEARPARTEPDSGPVAVANEGSGATRLERLQGTWQSRDDDALVLEIEGDRVTSWYGGERVADETLAFVGDCEERADGPESDYFVLTDGTDPSCYELILADETTLEYVYLARGNTLSYTRRGPTP